MMADLTSTLDPKSATMSLARSVEQTQVPESIKPIVAEYMSLIDKMLPDVMDALYLHGSIALNAFNEHFSDIDFITVVSRPCTHSDVERLKKIHDTLENRYAHWPLEGSYIQWDEDRVICYLNYHDRQ